jgi:selenocysteine-specific elongation factor
MRQRSVIVGTAGHIDHGKTALVKALTGIDADRLAEEKRRGITIDIGFAHMELPDSSGGIIRFGFVDVPGHEKFIRNMLAGTGGIDMVLLTIAADEGIKPQTREHFEICKLLGIEHGITIITKSDKVSTDLLAVTRASVDAFVEGSFLDSAQAPIMVVSSHSGDGIEELKEEMVEVARKIPARPSDGIFRLPIDRVFIMKGFGTVVTGTAVSGAVSAGEDIEALPAGRRFRVRGLQVHNLAVESARAGERAAINLAGAEKSDLARGMTLTTSGALRATNLADVHLTMLDDSRELKSGMRFHFHNLTAETIATLQRFSSTTGYARLRFASPMILLPDDRFILRQFSPVVTVGGGTVLDAQPMKSSSESFLEVIDHGDDGDQLYARIERRRDVGLSMADAGAEMGTTKGHIEEAARRLETSGRIVRSRAVMVTQEQFLHTKQQLLESVGRFHESNPLAGGVSREELRHSLRSPTAIFEASLERLINEGKIEERAELLRSAGHNVVMKDDESAARHEIEQAFAVAGLKVPAMNEVLSAVKMDLTRAKKIVALLLRDHVLIKLGDDLVFHSSALESLRNTMREYKTSSATIDVGKFKEMTNVSRKYAIPLLEFLDRERITRRQGDVRVLL